MAIPTSFELAVGGGDKGPVPVKITIGPKLTIVLVLLIVVLVLWLIKAKGR